MIISLFFCTNYRVRAIENSDNGRNNFQDSTDYSVISRNQIVEKIEKNPIEEQRKDEFQKKKDIEKELNELHSIIKTRNFALEQSKKEIRERIENLLLSLEEKDINLTFQKTIISTLQQFKIVLHHVKELPQIESVGNLKNKILRAKEMNEINREINYIFEMGIMNVSIKNMDKLLTNNVFQFEEIDWNPQVQDKNNIMVKELKSEIKELKLDIEQFIKFTQIERKNPMVLKELKLKTTALQFDIEKLIEFTQKEQKNTIIEIRERLLKVFSLDEKDLQGKNDREKIGEILKPIAFQMENTYRTQIEKQKIIEKREQILETVREIWAILKKKCEGKLKSKISKIDNYLSDIIIKLEEPIQDCVAFTETMGKTIESLEILEKKAIIIDYDIIYITKTKEKIKKLQTQIEKIEDLGISAIQMLKKKVENQLLGINALINKNSILLKKDNKMKKTLELFKNQIDQMKKKISNERSQIEEIIKEKIVRMAHLRHQAFISKEQSRENKALMAKLILILGMEDNLWQILRMYDSETVKNIKRNYIERKIEATNKLIYIIEKLHDTTLLEENKKKMKEFANSF